MAKLSKKHIAFHNKALVILNKEFLTDNDINFVFENYREDAKHINSAAGAYFTPFPLARDMALHIPFRHTEPISIIDLGAGIGVLSVAAIIMRTHWEINLDITCVEINPDYIEVGKKLLPSAKWICGDVLDTEFMESLGYFDCAISNPPYGKLQSPHKKNYQNSDYEYMFIESASKIADYGVFLIPQMSSPFICSGKPGNIWRGEDCKAGKFTEKTGLVLEYGIGVDTEQYMDLWKGISPSVEIVCCDFEEQMKTRVNLS